jgi:hypothetical protein
VKSSPAWNFVPSRGLVGVERALGLLDQREHVAHAEDARGHPVGVEDVEVVELLAVAGEHHLAAGDLRHRERRAAAGVAVELGQHDAVEADAVEERLRGVTASWPIIASTTKRHLVGAYGVADVGGLPHQLGVDAEAAGRVDDDHVVLPGRGVLHGRARDGDRVAHAVAGSARTPGRRRAPHDLQLLHRRWGAGGRPRRGPAACPCP